MLDISPPCLLLNLTIVFPLLFVLRLLSYLQHSIGSRGDAEPTRSTKAAVRAFVFGVAESIGVARAA